MASNCTCAFLSIAALFGTAYGTACPYGTEAARRNVVERSMQTSAWIGFHADQYDAWKLAMEQDYTEDAEQIVESTGTWAPRDYLIEYGMLGQPAYNGGVLKWFERHIVNDSYSYDDSTGTMTFRTWELVRLTGVDAIPINATASDSVHTMQFESPCGPRIQTYTVRLPSALRGQSDNYNPQATCRTIAAVCGARNPYSDFDDCVSFLSGLPQYCEGETNRGNSRMCRELHLMNAYNNASRHCPHISRSSIDTTSLQPKCPQEACASGRYIFNSTYAEPPTNCYTMAAEFSSCEEDPTGSRCCEAVRAYSEAGCFCNDRSMDELPRKVRMVKWLAPACDIRVACSPFSASETANEIPISIILSLSCLVPWILLLVLGFAFFKVQRKVHDSLAAVFGRLGLCIGARPKTAILLSILTCLCLGGAVAMAKWEVRVNWTYVPRGSVAFGDFLRSTELFGERPRLNECLLSAKDGGSMLRPQLLQEAWSTYHAYLSSRHLAKGATYLDVCERHKVTGNCTALSLFTVLGEAPPQPQESPVGPAPSFQGVSATVASLWREGSTELGQVLSTDEKHLRFLFPVAATPEGSSGIFTGVTPELERALAWEETFLDAIFQGPVPTAGGRALTRVSGFAMRSVDDEISRNMQSATFLMQGTIALIIIFVAVLLGGRPPRRSRLLLSLGTVCVINLAQLAGFALAIICQTPLTDISLMLVFVSIGVGADDMLLVTDGLDRQDAVLPEAERLSRAFSHVGPAIFLTSFTSLVSFLVASSTDLPAAAWFCAAAGWVVFSLFVLTLTLYAPMLLLDERRRAAGRYDCCICAGGSRGATATQGGESPAGDHVERNVSKMTWTQCSPRLLLTRFIERVLQPLVTLPMAALVIVLVLLAATAASVVALSKPENYQMGLLLKDSFMEDSYLSRYLGDELPDAFGGMGDFLDIVVEDVNFADSQVQQQLLALERSMNDVPRAIAPVLSFLPAMTAWQVCTAPGRAMMGHTFEARLHTFLGAEDFLGCSEAYASVAVGSTVKPSDYASSIAWSADGARVKAVRLQQAIAIAPESADRVADMLAYRERFAEHRLPGYIWASNFPVAERDRQMWKMITTTMVVAGVVIVGVLALFLHPVATVLVALCVGMVNLLMLGIMYLWDVSVDTPPFICLAMAIGLSVDYVVHIAHAATADGLRDGCVERALESTGAAVFKGAVSTFLGILLLAFSPTEVFFIFFKMLSMIVLFGIIAGFVFFPACLTLLLSLMRTMKRPSKTPTDDEAAPSATIGG